MRNGRCSTFRFDSDLRCVVAGVAWLINSLFYVTVLIVLPVYFPEDDKCDKNSQKVCTR